MISKNIPSMGELLLYEDEVQGVWIIEELLDSQSYDRYDTAKADYDTIVDSVTLTKVFGWEDNPYER